MVGFSNRMAKGSRIFKSFSIAVITLIAVSEWPPMSKKLSCVLTDLSFKTSFHISVIIFSVFVSGSVITDDIVFFSSCKAANNFLSTFPLLFSGSLSIIL